MDAGFLVLTLRRYGMASTKHQGVPFDDDDTAIDNKTPNRFLEKMTMRILCQTRLSKNSFGLVRLSTALLDERNNVTSHAGQTDNRS
jgi:hypothetical protein